MKKKIFLSSKDKKDWFSFIKQMGRLPDKDINLKNKNISVNKIKKIDLHGYSLDEANKMVNQFINNSYDEGCSKLLIVTGKGLRSKVKDDPYRSEKMSVLRYAVPEYIKNNEVLSSKISKISQADIKDGGEGTIYVYLKR